MKLVIDSNQLQTQALRDFLAKSRSNFAVLPDFVSMEAYKGNSFETICKSMSVLSDFPHQVIVLKGSRTVMRLKGRVRGLQRRLIDERQTAEFVKFVEKLVHTIRGQADYRHAIEAHGQSANAHFDQMVGVTSALRDAFPDLNKYTKEERSIIRSREPWPKPLADKIFNVVSTLTMMSLRDLTVEVPSTVKEASNTFVFRTTFAIHQLLLLRMAGGQLANFPENKLRNDMVDMVVVAYATYFDGLLSNDKIVNLVFNEVRTRLWAMFDAEIPSLAGRV